MCVHVRNDVVMVNFFSDVDRACMEQRVTGRGGLQIRRERVD